MLALSCLFLLLAWGLEQDFPNNGPSRPPCKPACLDVDSSDGCCDPKRSRKSKNTRCPLDCLQDNDQVLQYQVIEADNGFYPFDFGYGNRGGYAYTNFITNSPVPTRINIFDCYCAGDKFLVISDLGVFLPFVSSDSFNLECEIYDSNPTTCLVDPYAWHSSGWILVSAGVHNFTIQPMVSPFGQGTGFIIQQTVNPETDEPYCLDPNSPLFPCNLQTNAEDCCSKPAKYPVPIKQPEQIAQVIAGKKLQ